MRIEITVRELESVEYLTNHVRRRLRSALAAFESRVDVVSVRLDPMKGIRMKGIEDMTAARCQLRLSGSFGALELQEIATSEYVAVDQIIDRAARGIVRALHRHGRNTITSA